MAKIEKRKEKMEKYWEELGMLSEMFHKELGEQLGTLQLEGYPIEKIRYAVEYSIESGENMIDKIFGFDYSDRDVTYA